MLGIADVKPVAEQDTDQSDAPKIVPMTHLELDFKQAMASSNIAPYHQDEGQPIPNLSESENVGDDTENSVIVHERFAFIFKNETERAAMGGTGGDVLAVPAYQHGARRSSAKIKGQPCGDF